MPDLKDEECLLEITVPKGCYNALPISLDHEFEGKFVLLPPYTIFLVEGVMREFDKIVWKLKV
jgi:hypothetical protein